MSDKTPERPRPGPAPRARPAPRRPEPAAPDEALFGGFESVPLMVRVRVGEVVCRLGRLAAMQPGEVLRLDRPVGDPFDLLCDDRLLALVEPVADDEVVTLKVVEVVDDVADSVD